MTVSVLAAALAMQIAGADRPFSAPVVHLDADVSPFRRQIDLDGDPFPDFVGVWANSNNAQFRVDVYRGMPGGDFETVWSDGSVIPGSPVATHVPALQVDVADLDGDGDDDFSASLGNQVFDFLIEAGDLTIVDVDTSLSGNFALRVLDLDGDSAAEHIYVHSGDVRIEYTDGHVSTAPHTLFAHLPFFTIGMDAVVHDLDGDGDGDRDLLITTEERMMWVWLDANGELVGTSSVIDPGLDHLMTDVGDVDGDGDDDAVLFAMDGEYRVYRQAADGSFTLEAPRVGGPAEFLLDVDGDGDLDGVCCGSGGGTPDFEDNLLESDFEIAIADGQGNFAPAFSAPGLGSPELAAVVDVDLDGIDDIVAGRVVWYLDEQFARWSEASSGVELTAATLLDTDGDGDPDMAGGLELCAENDGRGLFAQAAPTTGPAPAGTSFAGPGYVGDVDGDGDADRIVAWLDGQEQLLGMRLLENTGGGHWVDAGSIGPAGETFAAGDTFDPTDALFADMNDDGRIDLVTGHEVGSTRTEIWLQGTDGQFALGQAIDGFRAGTPADFDLDGDVDLLALQTTSTFGSPVVRLQMLVNDAGVWSLDESVLFGSGWQLSSAPHGNWAVADIQGTGYPDIVLAATTGVVLLRNRIPLGGPFAFVGISPGAFGLTPFTSAATLSVGDVDGDGDVDIIAGPGSDAPRSSFVGLNDGAGSFPVKDGVMQTMPVGPLADLDGDGDLDMANERTVAGRAATPSVAGVRHQYGAGTPGTEGAQPKLGAVGPFLAEAPASLRVTGGLPGAFGALAISFAEAELPDFPLPGLTAWVDPVGMALVPFVLGGDPGQAGGGHWTIPYAAATGWTGLEAFHQVFLFDAGAASGFSSTAGLRLVYGG